MRITGGEKKGKIIKDIGISSTRYTSAKVREALFFILSPFLNGADVLDGFCGSGIMGIEALSRGAKNCTFVDISRKAILTTKYNVSKTNYENKAYILKKDVFKYLLTEKRRFDIAFFDPPYNMQYVDRLLKVLDNISIIVDNGIIIVERSKHECLSYPLKRLECFDEKRYGDTVLDFICFKDKGEMP